MSYFFDNIPKTVAFKFSNTARAEIEKVGGECISIRDLIEINPKGSNVKILQ